MHDPATFESSVRSAYARWVDEIRTEVDALALVRATRAPTVVRHRAAGLGRAWPVSGVRSLPRGFGMIAVLGLLLLVSALALAVVASPTETADPALDTVVLESVEPGASRRLDSIQSIAVDQTGRAWLLAGEPGTEQGVALGQVIGGDYQEITEIANGSTVAALQAGPDGSVWMGTSAGPQRLQGDEFELVGPPLSIGARTPFAIGPDGTPFTVSRERVVRLTGDTWTELTPHPGGDTGTRVLAVAPDGAVWVATGTDPDTVGLARFSDGRWELVPLPEGQVGSIVGVTGLAFDATGTTWARLVLGSDESCDCLDLAVGRLHDGVWAVDRDVEGTPFGSVLLARGRIQPTYDDVLVDRSGTVWANGSDGIARFRDGRWTWAIMAVSGLEQLTLGAEGSIWAAGVGAHRLVLVS